jgi:hypothetical protein
MYLQKVINFGGILKVKDKNSKIRSRIHWSEARIRGSGFVPRIHNTECSNYRYPINIGTSDLANRSL